MTVLGPRTGSEAVALYEKNPQAIPLAGGTDLMVAWNRGTLNHKTILDLSAVREWRAIAKTETGVLIGSLLPLSELQKDPVIFEKFPLLVQAASIVGAWQIQNRATLAGNIANASPAGDTFPPLVVYEAVVHTVSPHGPRSIPVREVFAGVKKTTLGPGELIASIELPFLKQNPDRQLFRKVGGRAAMTISKTAAAGLLWLKPDGAVKELRFALGSMAPTVRRLRAAEKFVKGKKLTPEIVSEALELLKKDVSPIDDWRSTIEYRLRVSQNLLEAFLLGHVPQR